MRGGVLCLALVGPAGGCLTRYETAAGVDELQDQIDALQAEVALLRTQLDGKAEVETCEVKGTVEGELTVRGRLVIRATGRVLGKVRYLDLHIEPGGKLAGQIEALDAPTEVRPLDSVPGTPAPRFTLAQAEPGRQEQGRHEPIRPAISVLQPLELTDMAEEPLHPGPGLTADRG